MESTEKKKYAVIITDPADQSFYEVLEYLYEHYPIDRAEEVAGELRDIVKRLEYNPKRGAHEPRLSNRENEYRYILYKRTSRSDIKVIYYIDNRLTTVYVTDFYPTEKDDRRISDRNQ